MFPAGVGTFLVIILNLLIAGLYAYNWQLETGSHRFFLRLWFVVLLLNVVFNIAFF